MAHSHHHPSRYPPAYLRPDNIAHTDINGVIYIETEMPPPPLPGPSTSTPPHPQPQSQSQQQQQPNFNDVAGVLRRNQACLNCRRRKLKCDAVRPHCGTCVRSYKHLIRTAPKSNPVLSCDYDDGLGHSTNHDDRENSAATIEDVVGNGGNGEMGGNGEEEDAEATKKKKRKATAEAKRRSSKKDEDDETEKLRKKIEALEAQLANQHEQSTVPPPQSQQQQQQQQPSQQHRPRQQQQTQQPQRPPPPQSWTNPQSAFGGGISAPSPTAFLEMLSSAATAQTNPDDNLNNVPGLRNGASESTMMTSTWAATPGKDGSSTGLTPFLSFADNQAAQPSNEQPQQSVPEKMIPGEGSTVGSDSRQSTLQTPNSGSHETSSRAVPDGLPQFAFSTNFFSLPNDPLSGTIPCGTNLNWPPPVTTAGLQPSTRTEGPWRGIETVDSTYPQPKNANDRSNGDVDNNMPFIADEAIQQQLLMDLFWPGWPPNLPEPHIVNDLVDAFFELVPNMPRLLHRARFRARLALPPTHSNFPHPALIYAICAAAASWCDPSVYERSARNRASMSADKTLTFGLKQAAFGKEAVQDGLNTGNRLFDVVRAMIVLSRVFIDDTRMLECWAYSGLVARMILPLGLNVRSAELALKSVMLPPPVDALEREERRITVWMAFYHDTIASSASGWGTSMSLDELSIPLPVSAKAFDEGAGDMEANSQDVESPEFWTKHPVPDPFVMVIKASVLMNRVNRFVRKWKNRHLREDDDLDGMQKPEFRELANAVACLQMSFPPTLRNPSKLSPKKKLDIDLISAHMLPHAAVICLYEPFADLSDPTDGPARRILGAAQSIGSIVQQLASAVDGATNFTSVMHSSASICLVTAARTCLLFYRLALNNHDYTTAESHRMDIEMIRMALGQFGLRFKIGHHHSQLIEYFLDRASNPTYEKLSAHYPEHPRPGAPELHPKADMGVCILNALNVKRGFWRQCSGTPQSNGVSPLNSTPDSVTQASSTLVQGRPSSASGSGSDGQAYVSRFNSISPATNGSAPNPVAKNNCGWGTSVEVTFETIAASGFDQKGRMVTTSPENSSDQTRHSGIIDGSIHITPEEVARAEIRRASGQSRGGTGSGVGSGVGGDSEMSGPDPDKYPPTKLSQQAENY